MNSCAICMKEDLDNSNIYTTDCKHIFCDECLDDWFKRGNNTCPLCRSVINTYEYNNENYKLVIYSDQNIDHETDLVELIARSNVIRNIVKQNVRLRFFLFSTTIMFLYYLNQYLYLLSKNNELYNELDSCILNNTRLSQDLDDCESNIFDRYLFNSGYYVNIFNGEYSRRCFYPMNYYNICFNE